MYYIILEMIRGYKGLEPLNGLFRVLYKDGRYSQRMYYDTSKNYASIFGGKVVTFDHKKI